MPDLRALLEAAVQREQASAIPRYDDLLARRGRRRMRRTVGLGAGMLLVIGAGVVAAGSHAPSRKTAASLTETDVPRCGAADIGDLEARWTLQGLVLNGTMTVRNVSGHPCLMGPPDIELQSLSREPLLSEGRLITVDPVAPLAAVTIPPGRTAQAFLGWGGGYCGPATSRVVIAMRFPDGSSSASVSGAVLPCLADVTYYRHGQSSAAVSGFRVSPVPSHSSGRLGSCLPSSLLISGGTNGATGSVVLGASATLKPGKEPCVVRESMQLTVIDASGALAPVRHNPSTGVLAGAVGSTASAPSVSWSWGEPYCHDVTGYRFVLRYQGGQLSGPIFGGPRCDTGEHGTGPGLSPGLSLPR